MKQFRNILIFIMILSFMVMAEEGMWLMNQLKQLDLNKKGLKIKVEDIYNPGQTTLTDAIVWLGGCSASFVSPDGLVLTNHHCAYGALQRASSKENDYITNGFLAKNRSEELEAIGSTASVLQEMRDVTEEVLKVGAGITDLVEKDKKIAAKTAEMTKQIEGDREDILARVAAMYNGKQYLLFVYKRYRDVRIVFAPPLSIGQYGGDIDNWMWPRHTGDFTYFRVYQAPDGSGAKYSKENVPVKPKNYLRMATTPLKEGDFTFIVGFPGNTTRWRTSNSVAWNLKYQYPDRIQNFKELIDLMEEITKDSPEGKIKVAGNIAGMNNTMKNFQGNLDGMKKTNFLQRKIDFEKDFTKFINSDPKLKSEYGDVLDQIKALYVEQEKKRERDEAFQLLANSGGTLAGLARQIYGIAREREKPEAERQPGFSERNVDRGVEQLHLRYYSFWEPVDKAMLTRTLNKIKNLPPELKIDAVDYIFKDYTSIDDFVNQAYTKSRLNDVEYTKPLFKKASKELEAMEDPFFKMAAATYDLGEANRKEGEKFNATITELRKKYLDALYAWKGHGLYPDANGTMRFTYGLIEGYKPADAVTYAPFTTLKGVIEKNTGVTPFDMPAKLAELHTKKDFGKWMDPALKDVPVAFLHHCDITGGNSGSAVMNAKGELIGLAFDGNYEAMTSDWQYAHEIQRTISVDIRYVLFVTEKYAGADFLLKEMGVK